MSSSEPGNQSTASAEEAKPVAEAAAESSTSAPETATPAGAVSDPAPAHPVAPAPTGRALRASYVENVVTAFKHINAAVSSEGRKLRATDYISVILLPLAALLLAYCCSNPQGMVFRPYLVLVFNIVALYFIGDRIGVIKTMSKRQTHLIWVIMCACFLLGCSFSLLLYDFVRALEPATTAQSPY